MQGRAKNQSSGITGMGMKDLPYEFRESGIEQLRLTSLSFVGKLIWPFGVMQGIGFRDKSQSTLNPKP